MEERKKMVIFEEDIIKQFKKKHPDKIDDISHIVRLDTLHIRVYYEDGSSQDYEYEKRF